MSASAEPRRPRFGLQFRDRPGERAPTGTRPQHAADQEPIVVGLEKQGLAPITALGDMVGQVRNNNARDPGHACASLGRFAR